MKTELIIWYLPSEKMPDENTTVLLDLADGEYLLGYHDDDGWKSDISDFPIADTMITAWAETPAGHNMAKPSNSEVSGKLAMTVCNKLLAKVHANGKVAYHFLGTETLVLAYEAVLAQYGYGADALGRLDLQTPHEFLNRLNALKEAKS